MPPQNFPPNYSPNGPPPPGGFNTSLPARPPSLPSAPGLPQRPGYAGNYYPGTGAPGFPGGASTVDELVAGAARSGDDIDQLIRMAEAGIKVPLKKENGTPTEAAPAEPAVEKKSKKDKDKGRMIYSDPEFSPEERMAQMPRYAYVPSAA